jgi:hypothetical protein
MLSDGLIGNRRRSFHDGLANRQNTTWQTIIGFIINGLVCSGGLFYLERPALQNRSLVNAVISSYD